MTRKKDNTEDFLTEFKRVENLIQQVYGSDKTFRDIETMKESQGDAQEAKRMQVCRIIRNYASHNPDINDFMPIPEEACQYMRKIYAEIEREVKTVKDSMSRTKALSIRDNISYAAQRLAKLPAVPVVDDQGIIIGVFDYDVLRKCVADELSLKTKFGKDVVKLTPVSNNMCVEQSRPMEEVMSLFNEYGTDILFVTNDGKAKGKYIGTITKAID